MRARFNFRAGAMPEEMSLCRYSRSSSVSSTTYFFLIERLSSETDQPQDKPLDRKIKSALTEN
jgi:hypothetical protein